MPTLIETNSINECVALAKELNLDFIEINMNMPEYQLDKIDVENLKNLSEQNNIYYTIHLDENLNFCDFNPYVASAYLKTVADTISLAKQLDIPVLNMHLSDGVYFTLPDKRVFLFEKYCEHYLKAVNEFIRTCETEIGDSDIKICIENCNGFKSFHKKAIELMLNS
ncbi:MAG: sugar phosphate isomerase/epimerase, partial [Clostridia bacterium]|nr:sugar phosphate isomerase/epimerase [Clostridia bacterium]